MNTKKQKKGQPDVKLLPALELTAMSIPLDESKNDMMEVLHVKQEDLDRAFETVNMAGTYTQELAKLLPNLTPPVVGIILMRGFYELLNTFRRRKFAAMMGGMFGIAEKPRTGSKGTKKAKAQVKK